MSNFKVDQKDAGKRLDLVLPMQLPQYSRSAVRKLLDQGKVQINGNVEYRPNYRVLVGEEVLVMDDADFERQSLPGYDFPVTIVYQDQDIVIVDKPVGLHVHPVATNDHKSLLNAMYSQLEGQLTEYGINLVNRIDKETSGLVVMAISPQGAWHYAKEFAQGRVQKQYAAVVSDKWLDKFGEENFRVTNFLSYDNIDRRQQIVRNGGEFAETEFVFDRNVDLQAGAGNWVMLKASPHTGRTHQIRVHLAGLGFPILGDTKYGGAEYSRLMLHAWKLRIRKPATEKNSEGEELRVEAKLPSEFML